MINDLQADYYPQLEKRVKELEYAMLQRDLQLKKALEEIVQLRGDRDHFDNQHRLILADKNAMQVERDQLKQQLAERVGVIDDFITACGFNVNDGFQINSYKIKQLKQQLAQAQAALARVEEVSSWIYPASWTENGVTNQRTERQDGWNDAVMKVTEALGDQLYLDKWLSPNEANRLHQELVKARTEVDDATARLGGLIAVQNEAKRLEADRDQLKQQLAQAQAALRYAVAVCRFSRSHEWPTCPSSEFAEFSTLLDALDTKLRAAGLIEQIVKQTDTPSIEYDEVLCEKLQGWLCPDEAKALRSDLEKSQLSEQAWKDKAINAMDEAKRLEADCAAMREALEIAALEDEARFGTHYQNRYRKALSSTAGADLLSRLHNAQAALKTNSNST